MAPTTVAPAIRNNRGSVVTYEGSLEALRGLPAIGLDACPCAPCQQVVASDGWEVPRLRLRLVRPDGGFETLTHVRTTSVRRWA